MSHAYQSARLAQERRYPQSEKVYLSESEYDAYLMLTTEHTTNSPEMEAVYKKVAGHRTTDIVGKRDRRLMKHSRDMRTAIHLPPRAPEERYPHATDVSSHPHIVEKSDTGRVYASDYFREQLSEFGLSFVPLQRREDKTPLSPITNQGKAIIDVIRQSGIFPATQLAFQGEIPIAYKHNILKIAQE